MADRNALMAGYQSRGGVLDTLGLPPVQPAQAPSLMQALTDYAGRGLGVVDHWAMGIPSTMAGLVNSAIPGQPLGDLWSAKSAAEDARSAVAQSGGADLLALPDAFMGSLGNVPAYAKPAAQLAPPAARQAGRIAESAIAPVYNALPDNSVGMFAGKLAKTADTAALARAEDMAAKGLPREQIWNDTGWFQGKDGKWRFEIDDSGAMALGVEGKLSDVVPHQTLYQAYPDVGAIDVTHRQMPSNLYGEYSPGQTIGRPWWARKIDSIVGYEPDQPSIGINPSHRLNTGTHIHETQHAVQDVEGFARGGLADTEVARRLYNRLAGEVEARAVEQRMELTADERRARPPWEDYDVPESDQIVRFGGSGPQMSLGDGSAGGKLTPPPAGIEQVWGPKWDIAMGQQYRIAEAGGDLSTMYDILTAKLSKASGIDPAMRTAMEAKVREIRNDMGPEWRKMAGIADEPPSAAITPPPGIMYGMDQVSQAMQGGEPPQNPLMQGY